ncbi:MAG: helix-turn-helix domain-containing protein [Deltaproteobacteria bacterium]|nr:helix-turn-helix domain-containing protein [Deltaproteobacteria bacterium]
MGKQESVGAVIKRRRVARGLSQGELAEALGVSRSAVSHWETDREAPTDDERAGLEQILGGAKESQESLAAWLGQARRAKGLSLEQLAEKTGLTTERLHALEVGRVTSPRKATLSRLSKALGKAPKKAVHKMKHDAKVPGVGAVVEFDPHDAHDRPKGAGLYVLLDNNGRPIHVGHAKKLKKRLETLATERWFTRPMVDAGAFVQIASANERERLSSLMLKLLKTSIVVRTREQE